jgi:hydroxymethylpyrimidine/phosphomethylpyrimidine kinase
MSKNRPFVLSIAGFDPSGGAGVLADCKTFEHEVYGWLLIRQTQSRQKTISMK